MIIMKKIYYLILLITGLLLGTTSCDMFKIDNFDGPDAQVFGAIRDSVGGGLVETDLQTGSLIGTYELGKYVDQNPELRNWYIMESGEYRNNLVFSNTYRIEFISCNFFPYNIPQLVINPGPNQHDFLVVPYIRIKNLSITHDVPGNRIVATFNIEGGKPTVKVASMALYSFTDMHVGEYIKKTISNGTGQPTRTFSPAATIDPATVYTLSIDLAANASVFSIHRNYYFRVGVKASQSGVGTIRSNYAPYVVIAL
jgi:hypothetical protein